MNNHLISETNKSKSMNNPHLDRYNNLIKYKQMAKSKNMSSQQSLNSTKNNFYKNPDKSSIISNKSSSDFNRTI